MSTRLKLEHVRYKEESEAKYSQLYEENTKIKSEYLNYVKKYPAEECTKLFEEARKRN